MIVIADLHLGRENDSIMTKSGPSQTIDIETRLYWIVGEVKRLHQFSIAVAGDIFNKVNPSTRHIAVFFKWLSYCADHQITVYLIGGNHDAGVDWMNMSMIDYASLQNVYVFTDPDEVMVSDGRSEGHVLFWPHMTLAKRELIETSGQTASEFVNAVFPKANIIITHGQVDQSEYVNDIFFEAGDAMIIDPRVFPHAKKIVSGHIHNAGRYGAVEYPGSLTVNNFGEVEEEKGYIDLDVETGETTWHSFPDDTTPWRQVDIDLTEKDETSLDEEDIKAVAKGAVLKIVVIAKRHGTVNESYIREKFNKYGKITRFETKLVGGDVQVVKRERKSHIDLLNEYMLDIEGVPASDKATALLLGNEIIEGCLNG